MAGLINFYGRFHQSIWNKQINMGADTFKVMLCTDLYVPDQDNHQYKSQITHEVSGPGYTAGGTIIPGGLTVAYDAANNKLSFGGAAVSWPNATIEARFAILYDATPATDATRPLVGYADFGANMASTTATFAINWTGAAIGEISTA